MHMPFANESDFWNWELRQDGFHASLNIDTVVRNTMQNMARLEEGATLKVVLDFLRERGYTVVEPEGDV